MTLIKAIEKIDEIKPNVYTQEQKIDWISELDGKTHEEVIKTHNSQNDLIFAPYTSNDLNVTLIIPFPHDNIYVLYLGAQIDLANADISRYNNRIQTFYTAGNDFYAWYNRTHLPVQKGGWKIF